MDPDRYIETPWQFAQLYHELECVDPRLDLATELDIQNYDAGWPQDKANTCLNLVARKLGYKNFATLPATFSFPNDPRVDSTEEFYCNCIRRAFGRRGSPLEIRDALRVAILVGMTTPAKAKADGQRWFGQDCNSFVGNWLGLSPMIGIPGYVRGYKAIEFGQTKDLPDCVDLLAGGLPPRADPEDVKTGDVIVTYSSKVHDLHKWRWVHIALVEALKVGASKPDGAASVASAEIRIAEWGKPGPKSAHQNMATVRLVTNLLEWKPANQAVRSLIGWLSQERLAGRTLVGWQGVDSRNGLPTIRIILDASKFNSLPYRGFHIGGVHRAH